MSEHNYYVYVMANKGNQVIYIGVTNNLLRRVAEHRSKRFRGFTEKYNVTKLVYFEETADVRAAISREKEIKKWRREKKNQLIESMNAEWDDLVKGLWGEVDLKT
jgi:putative endonuclease